MTQTERVHGTTRVRGSEPFTEIVRRETALWMARLTVFGLAIALGFFGYAVVGPFVAGLLGIA